jgi:hypothetical protein
MSRRPARTIPILVLTLAVLALPRGGAARPLYFDNLVAIYGLTPADDIHACGVCHRLWTGTGARNPYGSAIEAQLYLAKPIATAIADVAGDDTDGDGFTNGDELGIHRTLPGYSCANYFLAEDPPPTFQSLITPGVPSCLDPKDIRIVPTNVGFATEVGTQDGEIVEVINNGSDDPITVSAYGFLAGASTALSVSGPATPIVIPVGGSVELTVTFSPPAVVLANGTLRITSDDPDEPDVDVAVSGISFTSPLASPADRAGCLRDVARQMERYTKTHVKEWGKCFAAELGGVACDAGRRDLEIAQAEARLRGVLGGVTDRFCAPKSLTPVRLGLPGTCGGGCGAISVLTLSDVADCLVCRQTEATNAMLGAAIGAAPPDVPGTVLTGRALGCGRSVLVGVQKAIRKSQKALDACRVDAILTPADCAATTAPVLAAQAAKADARFDRCEDTTGMDGCRFEPVPDPACLGAAATDIADDLADAVFGPD